MQKTNIIETFRRIGNLSAENKVALLKTSERKEYLPKTTLQEEGKIRNDKRTA